MKYASARVLTLVVAVVVLLSTSTIVQAQSGAMTVKIPFDFYIGSEKFPSGHYTLLRGHTQGSLVQVLDRNGRKVYSFTTPITRSKNLDGRLIFNRYGGYHFLAEVRWMGSDVAALLPKSSLEYDIAKNIAAERVAATNDR